ncbi:BRO-N domain-containing protein [Azotobacter salinestris]|uniref:BRO-N domain-containing protein n=1 Tax=Azotobacter salinestris TaxID=69964 RepID=UPI001266CFF2|nr:BRO family protein [Azotobacter salinestris]
MQALAFRDTQFDVIDRNGKPWLRANQIGLALGYADASSINRIYARNAEEFTDQMTGSVKLTDPNGVLQETRIFSLRGAHLLAMFARTKIAAEFRKWVLDVLDKEVAQEQVRPVPSLTTRRWLVSFDHMGREQIKPIPNDACVMTIPEVLKAITEPGELPISTEELFAFVVAAMANLKARTDYQSSRIKKAWEAGLKI